jgi:hypothetical protein
MNRKLALLATLCASVCLATSSSPAVAAKWTMQQLPPQGAPPAKASLFGVSCPTGSLCVAVGTSDTIAFSRNPTAGHVKWHLTHPPFPLGSGKTCTPGAPGCPELGGGLDAVSCASRSLCVAVSLEGFIYAATHPAGGARAWSPTVINEGKSATHLTGVSCPSRSLCVAVSGRGGDSSGEVLTSTHPTSRRWKITQLGRSLDFRGVSCGAPSLCVAVTTHGRILVSTHPAGGASAWRELGTPGGAGDLGGVACLGTSLCAAGNAGGNILTSTNPAGGAGTWGKANAGGSVLVTGLSCPESSACLAVDNNGDALTSTDPTGPAGSWHFKNLIPYRYNPLQAANNALFGASCPSRSFCALVGSDGHIFTSSDPFSAPSHTPNGKHRRKAPRRPRAILLFPDNFGAISTTRRRRVRAHFRFHSPTKVRGFECKRDRGLYRPCHSPLTYWATIGRHVLQVRAIGPTGLPGKPAAKHFLVKYVPPEASIGSLWPPRPPGSAARSAESSGPPPPR